MSFVDFFRPKWKHSDPDVRMDAVRDLDTESQLIQVLRSDEDARVRRLALKKVTDADVLAEVAESDADETLRRAASEKATEIFLTRALGDSDEPRSLGALKRINHTRTLAEVAKTAALDGVRRAALARLSDDRSLGDVARHAKDPATRKLAVERIHDSQLLRDIAIGEMVREVGVAAVEQIQETAVLEVVAKKARSKQVAAAARERLPAAMGRIERSARPTSEVSPEARRRARESQLIRELDHAIGLDDLGEAERAVAHVKHEWNALPGRVPGDDHQQRFDKVLERFAIRKRTLEEAHRAHQEASEAQQRRPERSDRPDRGDRGDHAETNAPAPEDPAVIEARTALCLKVEGLEVGEDKEAFKAAVGELRSAWQELPRLVGPNGKALEIRFRKATEATLRRGELALTKEQLKERLEALVGEAEALGGALKEVEPKLRTLRKRLADLEVAGFDEEVRARFRRVEERVEAEKAELARRRAEEEVEGLRRLEELVSRLEGLGEDERKKIEGELKAAASAFGSTRLRGPHISTLRDRYTAVRDRLATRAQELRDAENWKRWANVPRLEKLCESMETIARLLAAEQHPVGQTAAEAAPAVDPDAEAELDAVEAAPASVVPAAKAEVATAPSGDTAERAPAPAAAGAGEVVEKKIDFKKAIAEMKALQGEWKTVGPAPKERSEQLWQRFKIAGDEVYHRTHVGFEKMGEARGDNLAKKEELCVLVEALVAPFAGTAEAAAAEAGEPTPPSAGWRETAEKVKGLQERWKKVGPVDKDHADAIWKRFRGACDQFFGKRKEFAGKASSERNDNLRKQEELCARVEQPGRGWQGRDGLRRRFHDAVLLRLPRAQRAGNGAPIP